MKEIKKFDDTSTLRTWSSMNKTKEHDISWAKRKKEKKKHIKEVGVFVIEGKGHLNSFGLTK